MYVRVFVTAPHTTGFLGEGDRGRPSKVIHHFLLLPPSPPIGFLKLPKLYEYRFFCHVERFIKKYDNNHIISYLICIN